MQKTNQRFSVSFIQRSLFVAALLRLTISAHAQLGEADLDGLRINAHYVFLNGDTRNPNCTIHLGFWGRKLSGDVQLGPVRIIRALGDGDTKLQQSQTWFPRSVALKGVSRSTKSITLEGEVELLTPATPYPVFTNFMEQRGETLHNSVLEQYGIKLTCLHQDGSPRSDFQIQVEDPQKKFLGVKFLWPDGSDVASILPKGSTSFESSAKTYNYSYVKKTSQDVALKVRIDLPMKSETYPFKLKIRPPWVLPDNLEVKVMDIDKSQDEGANTSRYWIQLGFSGAPLTNAVGIGRLQNIRAVNEAGTHFEIRTNEHWWFTYFSQCRRYDVINGESASLTVPLHGRSNGAASIRILEGDAELFRPSLTNHGIVVITNVLARPGDTFDSPVLKEYGVTIKYLGADNFRAKTNEWNDSPGGRRISGGIYAAPPGIKDSLLFSIEDPNGRVFSLPSWIAFLDEKGGETISPRTVASSSQFYLFTFGTIPKISGVRLYVATPESLERVHFKVENVPLP